MNASTDSRPEADIDAYFSDQRQHHQPNLPLLLRPSYSRSKSSLLDELRTFRVSLKWCALDHSSWIGKFISYFMFVFFTIVVPITSSLSVKLSPSFSSFNLLVQFPGSGLALLGFFTLCRFFRKYELRQLLFLDGLQDDSTFVRRGYTLELDKVFRCLAFILLPSFLVELAHKIIFFSSVKIRLPYINSGVPLNAIMFFLVLGSWVYRTWVFLLVCILFRLTCELQILRFQGLHKMFEGCGSDAGEIFQEHKRIRKQLSITSHRYRFFIIASMVVITVSQFAALLLVLASKSKKSFLNSGDLVVCSAVEVSGFFLCLLGAARITHRAQGMAAAASRWHMSVTAAGTRQEKVRHRDTADDANMLSSYKGDNSDSDTSDIFITIASSQDPSYFQTRHALVSYLQHNSGGITLFGFALDRGLLHTLFAFEFSLMMWVVSKVVVLS
ncbi:hypothetical protein SLE2022_184370 [Rubroshorea leprosula]